MSLSSLFRVCPLAAIVCLLSINSVSPLAAYDYRTSAKSCDIEASLHLKSSCFCDHTAITRQAPRATTACPEEKSPRVATDLRQGDAIWAVQLDWVGDLAEIQLPNVLAAIGDITDRGQTWIQAITRSEGWQYLLRDEEIDSAISKYATARDSGKERWPVTRPIAGLPPRPVLPARVSSPLRSATPEYGPFTDSMLSLHNTPAKTVAGNENSLSGIPIVFDLKESCISWSQRTSQRSSRSGQGLLALSPTMLSPKCSFTAGQQLFGLDQMLKGYNAARELVANHLQDPRRLSTLTNQLSVALRDFQTGTSVQLLAYGDWLWGSDATIQPYFTGPHLIACNCADGQTVLIDIRQAREWGLIVPTRSNNRRAEEPESSSPTAIALGSFLPQLSDGFWPTMRELIVSARNEIQSATDVILAWYSKFENVRTAAGWKTLAR